MDEANRKKYPYHRAIFNSVDIDTLERVNFSYVRLPEDYFVGESSGRRDCAISRMELNDRFIGVAQMVHAQKEGLTDNESKNTLLRVSPCLPGN